MVREKGTLLQPEDIFVNKTVDLAELLGIRHCVFALGAAGALEAVAVLLAMQHGKVPPTAGLIERDPELPAINIVEGGPADWEPGPSLSNSFGFGGHNGTLVLGPA